MKVPPPPPPPLLSIFCVLIIILQITEYLDFRAKLLSFLQPSTPHVQKKIQAVIIIWLKLHTVFLIQVTNRFV